MKIHTGDIRSLVNDAIDGTDVDDGQILALCDEVDRLRADCAEQDGEAFLRNYVPRRDLDDARDSLRRQGEYAVRMRQRAETAEAERDALKDSRPYVKCRCGRAIYVPAARGDDR